MHARNAHDPSCIEEIQKREKEGEMEKLVEKYMGETGILGED